MVFPIEPKVKAEKPIHPQDQNLNIPPQNVISTFPSWEVVLDVILLSSSRVAGPSAASIEPFATAIESDAFVKLQELLSLSTSQVFQCKSLDFVGKCLNDLATGGLLSTESVVHLTNILEQTR
ncbi:hypothetical protein ACFX10_027143 [Malus domestica]